MAPSRPQEKIRAKICRIENFAYLCNAQAIFRELSSVGSERLPYKQRVGGSNPSAPTPKAFHESERLFSYIHLPSFRLYPPPSQISHQRPGHVKHQGCKGTPFSKIHIAHPKKTGQTSLTDLTEFRTGHDRRMYHSTTADGDKATKNLRNRRRSRSWATKIRTWNDRTRICSVTITP